ncbi:lipopolysaccharide biosynthesis protein [Methylobacterium sp. JK268]
MAGRFARNSVFGTLAGLATALGSFLGMVVVARLLGPDGTGTVAYALWILTLAVTFWDLGIHQSLCRFLPDLTARGEGTEADALAAWLLRPTLGLAAAGTGLFVLLGSGDPSGAPAGGTASAGWGGTWSAIAAVFLLQFLASFGIGRLKGLQRFDWAAACTAAGLPLQLAAVALGAWFAGADGAIAGYGAASLLPLAACAGALRPGAARLDRVLRTRVIRYALYSWGAALTAAIVWSRLEIFFLQRYCGSEAVALFTIGFTFSNLAAQGPVLLTGGLLPYFAENYGQQRRDRIASAYATATRLLAFLLFPACLGLAAILPVLLPLVYGAAYAAAVPVAAILVVGAVAGATGAVGSQMIYAHERSDFIFASGLVGAALTVAAGFLIVPRFGMMGAALARMAIHGVMVGIGAWFITRRFGYPLPLRALGRLLLAALLSAAAAGAVIRAAPVPAALPAAIAAGILAYALAVRLLHALPPDDTARLSALASRLPGRARGPLCNLIGLLSPRRA